ncbi:putative Na+/H+ antiporter [Haloferula sp. A504]|uniref:putative Na+/H+ antiporter n=1 Tax=Haloferula sp. A504 TaxID=3373601 RepID=UPI0031C7393E|nr:putative Na+/H+ antiporter [Verrucomicrobiaceae bacterium E54]
MFFVLAGGCLAATHAGADAGNAVDFPISEMSYQKIEAGHFADAGHDPTLRERLLLRIEEDPFNLFATIIFFLAVLHTFVAPRFNRMAHAAEEEHRRRWAGSASGVREPVSFKATVFHFLGEVEAIFGIWVVPLFIGMIFSQQHGWGHAAYYIDSRNFTEPMFVLVIMAIASSRPVVSLAGGALRLLSGLGGRTPGAWWLTILCVAPLLGSFITEPAAMAIAAMLLGQQFYRLNPSSALKYATLGLLFVNVSVGGTLTHFAAPPVLMVATEWHWNLPYMFTHFGWRAILGIGISSLIYFFMFRKEFRRLKERASREETDLEDEDSVDRAPAWIMIVHLVFVAWTVLTLHHPAFFVGGFLFFIAFTMATEHHQYEIRIKGPLMVGFFLAGLVIHGGLQGWWIAPVLSSLSEFPLFLGATVMTAFNDNAAITFLAAQVPEFSPEIVQDGVMISKTGLLLERATALEYAVVAGAVTGGGLTVIANAPNPAGRSILNSHFEDGITPLRLLFGALLPTVVMGVVFMGW